VIDLAEATSVFEAGVGLGLAYSVLNEVSSFSSLAATKRFETAWQRVENDASSDGLQRRDALLQIRLALAILESDWKKPRRILSITSMFSALANVAILITLPLLGETKYPVYIYLCLAMFTIYPVAAAILEYWFWRSDASDMLTDLKRIEKQLGLNY